MPDEPVSCDLVYVHTDIPGGMTIREWRNHRAASFAAATGATGFHTSPKQRRVCSPVGSIRPSVHDPGSATNGA
jgi:hypothetical protein